MSLIIERFSKYLSEIEYPKPEEKNQGWQIKGMLSKFSNQIYKFDVRGMIGAPDGTAKKGGSFATKAEKFVFETDTSWLVFDIDEFLEYLKSNETQVIRLEEMIDKLFFVWQIKKNNS